MNGIGGSAGAPTATNYFTIATNNGNGDHLLLTSFAPVPEASSVASFGLMLALGLGGVAVARRRNTARLN